MRSILHGGKLLRPTDEPPQPLVSVEVARRIVLLMHVGLVLTLLGVLLAQVISASDPASLLMPLHLTLVGLFVWCLISWKWVWGNLFNPYALFIAMTMAFHGGYTILVLIGMDEQMALLHELSDETLMQTLAMVVFGFAFVHLGALLQLNIRANEAPVPLTTDEHHTAPQRYIGWVLILVALGPLLLDVRDAVEAVLRGGYLALYQPGGIESAEGTVLTLMREFFLPGVFFLVSGSKHNRVGRWAAIGLVLIYAVTYMFLGKRAEAMLPIIALTWLWHVTIRKLPIGLVGGIGAVLFLVVAPLIRQVRGLTGADRFSIPTLIETYTSIENPIVTIIGEMGSTLITVGYTIDLVPVVRAFEWGMGYVRSFLNAFPIIDVYSPYPEAGAWLAWTMKPDWAANGFGFGFSYIAEAFLNGGWWGAPFALLLHGIIIVAFLRWALHRGDAARVAVFASILADLLFYVRGESISLSRPLFWFALLPYLAVIIWRHIQQRIDKKERRTPNTLEKAMDRSALQAPKTAAEQPDPWAYL